MHSILNKMKKWIIDRKGRNRWFSIKNRELRGTEIKCPKYYYEFYKHSVRELSRL